jgi:hypothetical protein
VGSAAENFPRRQKLAICCLKANLLRLNYHISVRFRWFQFPMCFVSIIRDRNTNFHVLNLVITFSDNRNIRNFKTEAAVFSFRVLAENALSNPRAPVPKNRENSTTAVPVTGRKILKFVSALVNSYL